MERIFRALAADKTLTVSAISEQTGLAKSYISRVVTEMKSENIVWGTGKLHVDHEKLIRKWGSVKRGIFQSIKPLMLDVLIPERIKGAIKNYAVSGPFAELLVQGESPGKPVVIYIDEDELAKTKKDIVKLGHTGKGQVWLYTYDTDIFSGAWSTKGWKIVSIPQLCADLMAMGTYSDLGMQLFRRWIDAGRSI